MERRIRQKGIGRLHDLVGQASHRLQWHKKLLNAYRFHRECASNQKDGFDQMLANLPLDAAVILFDWKDTLTLPLSNVETGDMFWANSRKDVSVLGLVVWQYHSQGPGQDPEIRRTMVAYVSEILDHTALMSNLRITKVRVSSEQMERRQNVDGT